MKKIFFFLKFIIYIQLYYFHIVFNIKTSQKCVKKYKIPSWTEISNTEVLVDLMF